MISTNNETIVRAALVLAEGIFETGETLARHPPTSQLRSLLQVQLKPPRDVPVDVHIKVQTCFIIELKICSIFLKYRELLLI